MKIRLHQLNPVVGDLNGNKRLILEALRSAGMDGVELLILPEMCLTAYPALDLLESEQFRNRCYELNQEICAATGGTALLFGTILPTDRGKGRKMYNSALLAQHGKKVKAIHKTLLPTYDIFDDLRYFEPNRLFETVEFNGIKLGITICEDLWHNGNEIQYHSYTTNPALELKRAGAQLIINISASPFTNTKHESRLEMLQNHAETLQLPILYCNQTGSHTDVVFDGDSAAVNSNGEVVSAAQSFTTDHVDVIARAGAHSETEPDSKAEPDSFEIYPVHENIPAYPERGAARQFEAIVSGLSDYLNKSGVMKRVLFGLSGGIDSALVAVLATEAVGPENVTAITMPTNFSSRGSVTHSRMLADNLGIRLLELPIQSIFESALDELGSQFGGDSFDVAEENLQSRIRGMLLMTYANKFGGLVIPGGNKSEYAVGYATLYGDMNGALAILGDLYKTEVYQMANWLNEVYYKKEIIPGEIINKAPSAELRPDQKDSDSLPEYEVLDDILYHYIERQKDAKTIVERGYSRSLVDEIIRLTDRSEFKRNQAAPILKLSGKSFGMGRRFPIVQRWTRNQQDL